MTPCALSISIDRIKSCVLSCPTVEVTALKGRGDRFVLTSAALTRPVVPIPDEQTEEMIGLVSCDRPEALSLLALLCAAGVWGVRNTIAAFDTLNRFWGDSGASMTKLQYFALPLLCVAGGSRFPFLECGWFQAQVTISGLVLRLLLYYDILLLTSDGIVYTATCVDSVW